MEIIKLKLDEMLGKKPFIEPEPGIIIAGGSVRQWFTGDEKVSDVDIFGSYHVLEKYKTEKLKDWELVSENNMNWTFKKEDKIIQLIHGRPLDKVEELFDSFDYTICQFAWTRKTDSQKSINLAEGAPNLTEEIKIVDEIFTTKEAIISVLRKHLSVHKISPEFAIDSLRRAFKYHEKGFKPCMGTLRDITNSLRVLTDEQVKNSIEISPNGGKRFVRFD